MRRAAALAFVIASAVRAAQATDLNVSVKSRGSSTVTVPPGATVSYDVIGQLGDSANQGLAAFAVDLDFSAGPLTPAQAPAGAPMSSFASPQGLNNPAGFGGTVIDGRLVQIGGMQNVMNNTPAGAPAPIGTVGLGVAQAPIVLARGSFAAPTTQGTYSLNPSNVVGAVIRSGEDGNPSWGVAPTEPGTAAGLSVIVSVNAPAGAVPDGGTVPGTPLLLAKRSAGRIQLSWGTSCYSSDSDYEVYRGSLSSFTSHVPQVCTTGGATNVTLNSSVPSNSYFLVVPRTPYHEGSYGTDSGDHERPASASACVPRITGACQ